MAFHTTNCPNFWVFHLIHVKPASRILFKAIKKAI